MVEPETELVHVVDDGRVEVRVRAEESRDEDGGLVAASGVVVVLAGWLVGIVDDDFEVPEPEVAKVGSSLTLVTKLIVVATFDMLVEGKEAAMVVEMEALSTAEAASMERESLSSETSADRIFDGVESRPSFLAAEAAFKVVTEGIVFVVDCEVTERPGVMHSVEATVRGTGASVGVVVPATVVGKLLVGNLVARASASSGMEGILLSSTSSGDILAALMESAHTFASSGVTVLEGEIVRLVETGTAFEIVTSETVVIAVSAGTAEVDADALGLNLVGVLVSPSWIWASSFSGVLRPDVVGGGPGLRTGFGSKAGFPADSCADTLGRI